MIAELHPPLSEWWFRARVLRVVDADSLSVMVDLGFHVHINIAVRVLGLDAPELSTPEGRAAALFAMQLLVEDTPDITLRTEHDRSFARWLADVWLFDGRSYADVLIAAGHGRRRPG